MAAPSALAELLSDQPYERAAHSYGKSYRDIVRGARGEFPHPPDQVAFPRSEADLVRLLDWCAGQRLAAIPYGGGSSVVGGVEPVLSGDLRGAVSIDLQKLDRVLEIDAVSRAARIQAGILGPALESQLRPQGSRFATSRSLSSSRAWAAGSPPRSAGTTRRSTPTSTNSWKRCAW